MRCFIIHNSQTHIETCVEKYAFPLLNRRSIFTVAMRSHYVLHTKAERGVENSKNKNKTASKRKRAFYWLKKPSKQCTKENLYLYLGNLMLYFTLR